MSNDFRVLTPREWCSKRVSSILIPLLGSFESSGAREPASGEQICCHQVQVRAYILRVPARAARAAVPAARACAVVLRARAGGRDVRRRHGPVSSSPPSSSPSHYPVARDKPYRWIEALRAAVATLHEHGFVIGRLHGQNVFVPRGYPDEVRLVNFSRAGKAGKAGYPSTVSLGAAELCPWHPEMRRGGSHREGA